LSRIKTQRSQILIKIGDKRVNIYFAKIVYLCEECHASLDYRGAGLACSKSRVHRGFIHRDEAAKIETQQKQNISELENIYKIENGKVIIK